MNIIANEPILRIFFNIDIIGSTNYKVKLSNNDDIHPWLPLFKDFYYTFPKIFQETIIAKQKDDIYQDVDIEELKIWKLLGDEIIFYATLIDSKACGLYIDSLIQTMRIYQEKYLSHELGLKACAYTAGFPVNNIHIRLNNVDDFIGPNIDTGFRLMKFASIDKIPISIELAYILSHDTHDLDYLFDGYNILKGVLNNQPYPIFSVNTKNNNDIEKLMPSVDIKEIKKFSINFIKNHPLLEFPFILNDKRNLFTKRPDNYDKKFQEIKKIYGFYYPHNLNSDIDTTQNIKELLKKMRKL